jgi:phosphohistidine phosphatase
MKRLILVRHAKTEVLHHGITDFERRLKPRGHNDSSLIAEQLKNLNILPDHYMSSPATRAEQTAHIFAGILRYDAKQIDFQKFIYDGYTTTQFLDYLSKTNPDKNCAIVFGHNPEIAMLAMNLANEDFYHFPTTGTVIIDFQTDHWQNLAPREGRKSFFLYPKQFKTD